MSLLLVKRQFCLLSMHPDEQLALLLLVHHPEKKNVLLQKKDCWIIPGKLTERRSRATLRTGESQGGCYHNRALQTRRLKQLKLIFSQFCKSSMKVPEGLVSLEASLLGVQTAAFSLCSHETFSLGIQALGVISSSNKHTSPMGLGL